VSAYAEGFCAGVCCSLFVVTIFAAYALPRLARDRKER
jgi:hypothetical protein